LTDRQLDGVGGGFHEHPHGAGKVFDAGKKAILVEKSMIDGDVETAIGFFVEQTV
jgi:hypothetical protein